jgi:hypothetical protein
MFYAFIFLVSALCSSLHASNRVFNQDTFPDANWRMEVRSISPTTLYVRVDEGKQKLLEQTVTIGQLNNVQTPTCSLTPDHNGFYLSYVGSDGTSLRAHIDASATIDVLGNGSGIVNTGFAHSKSWGFKTSGVWRNGKDNFNAFYNLITEAKEFHNLGILQVATGHFTQNYQFNKGVFHMGLTQGQVGANPYAIWRDWLESKAVAGFQNGIVENYGVMLAESGLRVSHLSFNDYGYAHLNFLDLENAPLSVEQKGSVSAGTPQNMVPIVHVEEAIVGRSPRVRVASNCFLSVGQIGSSLSAQDWTNQGSIQTIRDSEFAPTQNWDNQGQIIGHGNITINNRTRPKSLGSVISGGDIKALISQAVSAAEAKQALGTSNFASNGQIIVDILQHTDHYLNTITKHLLNGRYTHQTETGYVFQRRETTRTQKAVPGGSLTMEEKAALQGMKGRHFARQALLNHLKDTVREISRLAGEQAGLLGQILQGLREAGLDAGEIQALVDDAEIGKTLMGLAMIDSVSLSDVPALISQQTDSSRALSHFYTQAGRVGMTVLSWAKHNGPELVGHLCDLANALVASGYEHPAVVGASSACNLGRFAKTTYSTFKKADAFFSKRHNEGRHTSGTGRSVGGSGSSSSSSSSVSGKSIIERPFGTYEGSAAPYHHPNSGGLKSPPPTSGQKVLDSSVPYGDKGFRVGVDKENKELVVFMRHLPGKYHGHVRPWNQLEPMMQKALIDAGKVRVLGSGNKIKIT